MPRDYSRVMSTFWTGRTGRVLRAHGSETQLVAVYLLTSPHANMLGLYYCPPTYIAHDTGLPVEGAIKALACLSEAGFAHLDPGTDHVWVVEMARKQLLETGEAALKPADKRVAGVNRAYAALPTNVFLRSFFEKYATILHLETPREGDSPNGGGLQAPSVPLRSTATATATAKDPATETANDPSVSGLTLVSAGADARPAPHHLFELWNRTVTALPKVTELSDERREKARVRLRKRPDLAWWEETIRIADASPFCQGEGERGWVLDFDFLIANGTNALKVREGKYSRNGNGKRWTSSKTAGNVAAGQEAIRRIREAG